MTAEPCRAKSGSLPRVSSLFRPRIPHNPGELVEAPGTAPGSTTLIPRTVYRHSRQAGRRNIGGPAPQWKVALKDGVAMPLTEQQQAEIDASRAQRAETRRPTVSALEGLLYQPF